MWIIHLFCKYLSLNNQLLFLFMSQSNILYYIRWSEERLPCCKFNFLIIISFFVRKMHNCKKRRFHYEIIICLLFFFRFEWVKHGLYAKDCSFSPFSFFLVNKHRSEKTHDAGFFTHYKASGKITRWFYTKNPLKVKQDKNHSVIVKP